MTYTATQSPMEDKADTPDPFYGAPSQDGFGEAFFNDLVSFDGNPWDVGDSDSSFGPASLPNPDSLMFTPTASSFNVSFLSEDSIPSSVSPKMGCPGLLSQAGSLDCEKQHGMPDSGQDAGGQSPEMFNSGESTSVEIVHPSPPPVHAPMQDVMFPVIPDTELLKLENINLQTPRPLSHSSPASPITTRQSNDLFDVFSTTNTASTSQLPGIPAADNSSVEGQRGRLTESRCSLRARSTSGISTQPSGRSDTGFSFVKGSVDNPFANPNSAPMPPPRKPNVFHAQKVPSPLIGISGNGTPYLSVSGTISRTPSPQMLDDMSWTMPSFSTPFPYVEKQDSYRNPQSESHEAFVGSSAAVQNATMNLARLTDGFEILGYEDYPHNLTSSDYLMPGVTIEPLLSRPRSQTTGMMNLSESTSLPSTPAQRPARTPSLSSRQVTPMSNPPRKVRTIRGESTSPSPARGRLRVGEPGAARSSSTAGDSSVRKRRSSSRRELRKPLATEGAGGFVNFTANDCQTLMTGVAPSGSSKTKAKREREEQERRRRLEQAARKAVEAAGGNVELLLAGESGLMHS